MDILTLYRIKNEETYIQRSIESCIEMSDKIIILDNHSTDSTESICKSFGDKIDFVSSPFDDINEARDKDFLMSYVFKSYSPPDWFMCFDGDEALEPGGAATLRSTAKHFINMPMSPHAINFQFLYIWDNNNNVRLDGVYSKFHAPRLWRVPKHDLSLCNYTNWYSKSGLHCGWTPHTIPNKPSYISKIKILHWGNATEELRLKKYVFYNMKDPNNFIEDRYRHIVCAGDNFLYAGPVMELKPLQEILEESK